MIKIPQEVIEEEKNYRNKVEELKKGVIEPERFKPYRVSMGIYEQRDNDTYMIRTRIPSGVISLEQLKKISELAKQYSHGYIHFTTRQDIQFHKVTLDDTVNIMEGLLEAGIVTRGTGGNTARNIGCSPLSGVSQDDVFDVASYALVTTEYALKDPSMLNLPRKYKIAYSNSPEDTGNATISDLGFVAKIENGEKGFEVYGAGGLGGSPNVSIKLADFIPASEVLYHVQAMKELFENEGDRTNKHKARIRYILQRLGEETFKAKYQEILQEIKKEKSLEVFFKESIPTKQIGEYAEISNPLIFEQKNKGYFSLYIHPENGNLDVENLDKVIKYIDDLNYEVSIRLTNTQGFFVRDLLGSDAENLLDLTGSFTSTFDIDNSVACAGAATCKLGLGLSQNLLSAIKSRFANVDEAIKLQLPRIFISGCQNSCGQHQKGEIGLYGRARRVADGLVPMYVVSFEGAVGVGKANLGSDYGTIPAKKIPGFLYELANLKSESGIIDFSEFVKKEKASLDQLIEGFSTIESETENPNLYYDFGSEEKFSLKGRGPGECSAGVLDVIKLDISNSQAYINEFEKVKESIKLYDASVSAARALLILKGVDTTKDRLIFKEFISHFVDTGHVKEQIKSLIEDLLDYKLGDLDSLENHYEEVKYLVNKVVQMYESLNTKLEITLPKEAEVQNTQNASEVEVNNHTSLNIVDLKGVKCPMNFVKAKIEMAKILSNETIGFYLDNGEPIVNVPKSLGGEGHEIIKIDDKYEGYNLLIVKKK
ncbi:Sulfite reductase (ferredoxin) [Alkaliphilus metalliredigens QYMF]|uniref:Sulfite reductase (Ferredoxin) n=1 Tax=Alkaliphilus metalliredigens (strain QYMF) TaxID=293826 RepID=A6TTV9_ALKMQ|nr:sulfurtransferase TusA family protein [Alkaliphilus metalliredigens]ABR49627.1 Sulfite reductase (ferredoxin) [Alkaliphilus metalliredigens QYMF]